MNQLALQLNETLKDTVAGRLLSEYGKRMFFPKGIVFQAGEAREKAKRFNATIGIANSKGQPMVLPSVARFVNELTPAQIVDYAPTPGDEALRKQWKTEMLRKNPELSAEQISLPMVVPGLTPGIAQAADLFLDAGDTIVIPDMYWDNYDLVFETRRSAKIVTFPMFTAEGRFNADGLRTTLLAQKAAGKTALLLNFPNNPTGYSPSVAEAGQIAAAVQDAAQAGIDILAIADDAYFGLFYEEGTYTSSIFSKLATLHPRVLAVKIDGSTKEDFVWGFRVGFLTFGSKDMTEAHYQALGQKLSGSLRATISNSNRLGQSILLKMMQSPTYLQEKAANLEILRLRYHKTRQILRSRTAGKAIKDLPFNSGYFMSFDCQGISADDLRVALLEKGIGTIALQGKYLRVTFSSLDIEQLDDFFAELFATADEVAGKR